ncbi:MAG: hypothetical protein ABI624_13775 [Casimicrobiaceae bacterium]
MANEASAAPPGELARLERELEEAEVYAQKLRERIVAIRDELAAGHPARALSLCNETLNEIDNATDVVTASKPGQNELR